MLMIVSAKSTGERMLFENPPKSDEGEVSPFADVSADRWSYYYIKKAYGTIIYTEEYGEKSSRLNTSPAKRRQSG